MLATFRPSQHVDMVWHVANMSACHARGIWKTTRQMDKRAKEISNQKGEEFPEIFLERTCSL